MSPNMRREILRKLGESQRSLHMALINTNMKKEKWRARRQRSFDEIEGLVKDTPRGPFCKRFVAPPKEGTLVLEVADNGCGISREDQAKLFQPFAQANKGIYEEYGGTGLGLWLSKTLLQAMKGNIVCSSVLGEGTTFTITLPTRCQYQGKKVVESGTWVVREHNL